MLQLNINEARRLTMVIYKQSTFTFTYRRFTYRRVVRLSSRDVLPYSVDRP